MFEAYKIAVRLSLVNEVSGGLMAISRQFAQANDSALKFQKTLKDIKRLSLIGGALWVGSNMSVGLLKKTLIPANDYLHQLNLMNMAGMQQQEIAQAIGFAWKTSSQVISTSVNDNVKMVMDLRNVFGDMKEAIAYLPEMAKIKTVLAASLPPERRDQVDDFVFSMAKALDIRGAVRSPEEFKHQAEMMTKALVFGKGNLTTQDFQMVAKFGRQATLGLSNEYFYEILPALMLEAKAKGGSGGSGGAGPQLAAGYRFVVQGMMNKRAAENLQSLGLISRDAILKTTTTGTTLNQGIKGSALYIQNPFRWTQDVLLPAIEQKYGHLNNERLLMTMGQLFRGNQLATQLFQELAVKSTLFRRDQALIRQVMSPHDAYQAALSNDPFTANDALHKQWENFKLTLGATVAPIIVPALIKLAEGLNTLATWLKDHPNTVKALTVGILGLGAAFMKLGGVLFLLRAGLSALSLLPVAAGLVSTAGFAGRLGLVAMGSGLLYGAYHSITEGMKNWLHPAQTIDPIAPKSQQSFQVNSTIHLDGRKVAQAVTQHQVKAADKPPSHTGRFDSSMTPYPVMLPLSPF